MALFRDFEHVFDDLGVHRPEFARLFAGSQRVQVKREIARAVIELCEDLLPMVTTDQGDGAAVMFPLTSNLPASSVFFLTDADGAGDIIPISNQRRNVCLWATTGIDGTDRIHVAMLVPELPPVGLMRIGSYVPGEASYKVDEAYGRAMDAHPNRPSLIGLVAGVCSLIAQPALCKLVAGESRQSRRRLERQGKALIANSTVLEWTVLSDYEKRASHDQ